MEWIKIVRRPCGVLLRGSARYRTKIYAIFGKDGAHTGRRWRTYRKKMAHIPGGGQIGLSWNLCRGLGFVPLLIKQRIDASM